jgi:hypothetical protein
VIFFLLTGSDIDKDSQFAAFCLVAFVFVWFFVPETKGKSLEDMDLVFGDSAAHIEKAHLLRIAQGLAQEDRNETLAAPA